MKSLFHKVAPLLSIVAISSSAMAEEAFTPPPASVTCMAVLVGVSVEAGRLCLPAYNPDGQARLQTNLKKIEARLLASPGWDEKRVDDYLREEGARGLTDARICGDLNEDDDTIGMIKAFIDADPVEFNKSVDELVARPGDPAKGDCI